MKRSINELKAKCTATQAECRRLRRIFEPARKAYVATVDKNFKLNELYRKLTGKAYHKAYPGVKALIKSVDAVHDELNGAMEIGSLMIDQDLNCIKINLRDEVYYARDAVNLVPSLRVAVTKLSEGFAASTRVKKAVAKYLPGLDLVETSFALASKRKRPRLVEVDALYAAIRKMSDGLRKLEGLVDGEIVAIGHRIVADAEQA